MAPICCLGGHRRVLQTRCYGYNPQSFSALDLPVCTCAGTFARSHLSSTSAQAGAAAENAANAKRDKYRDLVPTYSFIPVAVETGGPWALECKKFIRELGKRIEPLDVIVVGCGASGIAALTRLEEAGLNVIGLEASHRIGGRIFSKMFGNCLMDFGAAWCHGEKDNLVFKIANPHGLLGRPDKSSTKQFVDSSGQLVHVKAETFENILNDAVNRADKYQEKSIVECARSAMSNAETHEDPTFASYILEWFERNNNVGGEIDPKTGKSLRGLVEAWPCEGEFMLNWKGKGYQTILDVMMKKYPDPSKAIPVRINLNKEVQTISWGSEIPAQSEKPMVTIKCNDGSQYEARSVIVTVSLGVLKERYQTLFRPDLPPHKINAIKNLEFCVLDKIYIEFQKSWWSPDISMYSILWKPEDKAKYLKEEKWVTYIYGLQIVDFKPNILLAWIYGEGAKQMEQIVDLRPGIEKFLKEIFSAFKVTPIKNIERSRWASDPLTRGAYSYRSVATEISGASAIGLSEPILYKDFPVICFAGEATSHHRHSSVHGAIEAGYREADRLLEILK